MPIESYRGRGNVVLRLLLLPETTCSLLFLLEPAVQEEMPPLEGEGEDIDAVRMEEVD